MVKSLFSTRSREYFEKVWQHINQVIDLKSKWKSIYRKEKSFKISYLYRILENDIHFIN